MTWVLVLLVNLLAEAPGNPYERPSTPSPLRLPQNPASAFEPGLGPLRFNNPVALTTPPGETNRLFVVEQSGRIIVITNLAAPTRSVFLDLASSTVFGGEQGLLGLAFHPRYAENGRFFVFRTLNATTRGQTNRLHDRLSEFKVSPNNPHQAAPVETVLFQQRDEASNHNGGDLHFGPDGLLYVALGDEGGGDDQYNNGQVITKDLFAGLLRLDVDGRPDSLMPNPHPANEAFLGNYRIPADNPFVGATNFLGRPIADPSRVRTEFFAVGLRNPWRISFDPVTGELWVADVGQGAREAVFITRRGANHGWPFREGPIAGPRAASAPTGFTTSPVHQYVAPIHSYSHGNGPTQGRSITGGLVYRGTRFPALTGAYIFADYVSGNVWSLRRPAAGGGSVQVDRLIGEVGLSAFGPDPRNGDILAADLDGSRVLRLVPGGATGQPLPATLADTGAFANLATLTPAAGVVPYEVNLPFWSDGAEKRRWFHVPGTNRLTFTPEGPWLSPTGTVWVKHFDLPLGPAPTDRRQRLETRFLVRNASGVYGVTYRWTSATSAVLVPDAGDVGTYSVGEGANARTVTWRFPSRAECLACHNAASGGSLSFETSQLSRSVTTPDGTASNQIALLARAGYFHNPPDHPGAFRRHPALDDEQVSLEARARSYLAVNCAPCHRPEGAIGGGFFDTRLETPTEAAGLLEGRLNDSGNNPDLRVVAPGHPESSALLRRILSTGTDRMPPISSGVTDDAGAALLERWIASAASRPDFRAWLREYFGAAVAEAANRTRDADGDGASDYLEFLTGTNPTRAGDAWRLGVEPGSGETGAKLRFRHPAGVLVNLESTRELHDSLSWVPWGLDEDRGGFIPAETTERQLPLPRAGDALYLRARIAAP